MDQVPYKPVLAVLWLTTIVCGIWMHTLGRPLNAPLFTIHKLLALATVILTGTFLYQRYKTVEVRPFIVLSLTILALSIITLFITSALLSIRTPTTTTLLRLHDLATILAVVAMGVTSSLWGTR